jgi:large subunit ribosomal protein L2
MALKKQSTATPSQRHHYQVDKSFLSKCKPLKTKVKGLHKTGGRNNHGRITAYHRGGGHKRNYREIDFKRYSKEGILSTIEYDPNRSCWIGRVNDFESNQWSYILLPKNLKIGTIIDSGINADIKIGNALPLHKIPIGTTIFNIETKVGKGGQLVRSAGCSAQLIQKTNKYGRIRLPSGVQRLIPINCYATIGTVSNGEYSNQTIGKAGRARWLNKRPTVRGTAMNPIDHPHGGGQGKTKGGRPSVTPWGKITKGKPTRNKKRVNKLIIAQILKN